MTAVVLGVTVGGEMLTPVRIRPAGGAGVSTTTVVFTLVGFAPDAALALKVTVLVMAAEFTVPEILHKQVED